MGLELSTSFFLLTHLVPTRNLLVRGGRVRTPVGISLVCTPAFTREESSLKSRPAAPGIEPGAFRSRHNGSRLPLPFGHSVGQNFLSSES